MKMKMKITIRPHEYERNPDGTAVKGKARADGSGFDHRWGSYVVVKATNTLDPAIDDVLTPKQIKRCIQDGIEVTVIPQAKV